GLQSGGKDWEKIVKILGKYCEKNEKMNNEKIEKIKRMQKLKKIKRMRKKEKNKIGNWKKVKKD
ncbi:hypothetical protein RFI_04009, partial [Reticulomyxa filosa]